MTCHSKLSGLQSVRHVNNPLLLKMYETNKPIDSVAVILQVEPKNRTILMFVTRVMMIHIGEP